LLYRLLNSARLDVDDDLDAGPTNAAAELFEAKDIRSSVL
jgi:hypothetical protein